MKEITILGGGSAGWMTAIYLNKTLPKIKITLIESGDIDILGAGEGGVPIIFPFFKKCDIDIADFISKTNSTIKLGVKFNGWNPNKDYFHSFAGDFIHISDFEFPERTEEDGPEEELEDKPSKDEEVLRLNTYMKRAFYNIAFNKENNFYDVTSPFLENGIPDMPLEEIANQTTKDAMSGISIHFDARLLVDYLRNIGIDRGINVINDNINHVMLNEEREIYSLIGENGNYDVEFLFDCSGQNAIAMKCFDDYFYWSFPYLTLNSSLPFNLEQTEEIDMWTNADAMNFGWMWKIPLQNRIGCGYVFDDNFINFEEAQKEVEEKLGVKIEPLKEIKFKSGYIDKSWNQNCIALGMSQSFVEPLEATSLGHIIIQLFFIERLWQELVDDFNEDTSHISNYDTLEWSADTEMLKKLEYNSINNNIVREIADFIHLHYYTSKDDTEFWKTRKNLFDFDGSIESVENWNDAGESTSFKLGIWSEHPVIYETSHEFQKVFNEFNLLSVIDGLDIYNKQGRMEMPYLSGLTDENYEELKEIVMNRKKDFNKNALSQNEYLKKYIYAS